MPPLFSCLHGSCCVAGHEAADTSQLAAALHSSVQSAVTNNEQLSVQLSTTVTTKRGGCQHHPAAPAGKSAPSLPTACTADWAAAAQHLTSAGGSSTRSQQQLDQWLLQLQQQAVQHTGGSAALHGAAAGQYILYLLPLHDSSTHPSTDSTDSSSGGSLIVGRHRHAWLTYDPTQLLQQQQLESTAAAATIKVLSCCFGMHAGPAGLTTAGSLPISPAGQTVLSFSLLNADPAAGSHFTWDMESWEAQHLAPVAASLVSVTQVTVESQVLQYTPARLQGQWSDKHAAYVVKGSQLPFFLDSEWALEPGRAVTPREGSPGVAATAAAGEVPLSSAGTGARAAAMLVEPHVLQFVVYVPPPQQRPLQLLGRKGKLRDSNSYVIPAWGGLMVLNPDAQAADSSSSSSAAGGSRPAAAVPLTAEQSQEIAAVVIAQLQALFGVAPAATDITTSSSSGSSSAGGALEVVVLPAGRSGFSGWQVDALLRQRSGHDVREAARVLAALSTLVQELPNLEMPDLIGEQVRTIFYCGRAVVAGICRSLWGNVVWCNVMPHGSVCAALAPALVIDWGQLHCDSSSLARSREFVRRSPANLYVTFHICCPICCPLPPTAPAASWLLL